MKGPSFSYVGHLKNHWQTWIIYLIKLIILLTLITKLLIIFIKFKDNVSLANLGKCKYSKSN